MTPRRFDARRDLGEIASAFDLGAAALVTDGPFRGEQGQVWRVTAGRSTFAVKEMFEDWTEDAVATAARHQEAMVEAGVPVPRIVRTVDGDVLHQLAGGPTMRVYGWIDLCDADPLLDPGAVGATVAKIHRVRRTQPEGVHPWYTEPVGAERWVALATAARDRGAPFAADLEALLPAMIELEDLRSEPQDLQLCHSDLWADNVRAIAGAAPSSSPCVIDWENCGMADPRQELSLVLYEFGGADAARVPHLHRAYLDAGGPFPVSEPQHFWMLIAQLMHINERCVSLWLATEDDPAQRDRLASVFGEYVARPLTPALIERMIDAIT